MNLIPKKKNFDLNQEEFVPYKRDSGENDFESDFDFEFDEKSDENDEIFN